MGRESRAGHTRPAPSPDPATTPSGRTLTRRGASTRQRLVEAAWEVFSETPYDDSRVTEITARAGVATGTFYTYFASKEEVFRVVAGRALEEMRSAARRDPGNTERDPVRDIAYSSRQFFLACWRHRIIARSIEIRHALDDNVYLARRSSLVSSAKRIERWIRDLQRAGTCDPDVDPWYTAVALQAMNATLAYEQLVHHDDVGKVETLVDVVTPIWARTVGIDPRS